MISVIDWLPARIPRSVDTSKITASVSLFEPMIRALARDPDTQRRRREVVSMPSKLTGLGGEIGNIGVEEFAAFNRTDYERFGKLIRDANVKVEK